MNRPLQSGLTLAVLIVAGAGCSGPQRDQDFVPKDDVGRAALEAYLKAWQRGETSQAVSETSPQVMVVDDLRGKGRTLKGYTVLGPTPADAPLCFAVQLTLGNPAAEVRERYVVVGIDPLWVWRYDDYLMIMHWDHRMANEKNAGPPVKR